MKRLVIGMVLALAIVSFSFAIEIKDVLEKNVGHKVMVVLKGVQTGATMPGSISFYSNPIGKIISISEKNLVLQDGNFTIYVDLNEIAMVRIENDETQKK